MTWWLTISVWIYRVKCWRTGGLQFTILGFNYFELVLVTNVAGSGSIKSISVKGTNTGWTQMSRNWGVIWQGMSGLAGQALSFSISSTHRLPERHPSGVDIRPDVSHMAAVRLLRD
jgi:hypothetical protein